MTATGKTQIILFGASGHGRVVADIISKLDNFDILGFADDRADEVGTRFLNIQCWAGETPSRNCIARTRPLR